MIDREFEINIPATYFECLVLHRAMMEAKFGSLAPNDQDVFGSELLATIANRIIELIIQYHEDNNDLEKASGWRLWRKLSSDRREWDIAVRSAANRSQSWSQLSTKDKLSRSRIMLSPFVTDSELLNKFIKDVDEMVMS